MTPFDNTVNKCDLQRRQKRIIITKLNFIYTALNYVYSVSTGDFHILFFVIYITPLSEKRKIKGQKIQQQKAQNHPGR